VQNAPSPPLVTLPPPILPSCAVTERLTQQYYASVLTFIALLAAIGTSLALGAIRLSVAACAPRILLVSGAAALLPADGADHLEAGRGGVAEAGGVAAPAPGPGAVGEAVPAPAVGGVI